MGKLGIGGLGGPNAWTLKERPVPELPLKEMKELMVLGALVDAESWRDHSSRYGLSS